MEVDEKPGPAPGWTWAEEPAAQPAATPERRLGSAKTGGMASEPPMGQGFVETFGPPAVAAATLGAGAAGVASGEGMFGALKTALGSATPLVKYEVSKSIMKHFGVPESAAALLAGAFSGMKLVKGAATLAESEAAPAMEAATAAKSAAPAMQTVAGVAKDIPKVTPAEANQMMKWVKDGVPDATIRARILASRALMKSPSFASLPSDMAASADVDARNAAYAMRQQ